MKATLILVAAGIASAAAITGLRPQPSSSLSPSAAGSTPTLSWQADRRGGGGDPRGLGAAARRAVLAESPDRAFPFRPAAAGATRRIVVAHYIPVFPLSIDGKPPAADYYATGYLDPAGEGGRHRAAGGYLRERPLPAPVALPPPYRDADAAMEVARAARIGIDAFGADLLALSGQPWKDAVRLLDAAAGVSARFRIIPEPDMGSLPRAVTVEQLADALAVFHRHPAGYRLRDGRLLVMPFMAERRPVDWWRRLAEAMAVRGLPILIAPVPLDGGVIPALAAITPVASVWGDRYATGDVANLASARRAARAGITDWIMPVAAQDYRPKDALLMEARNSEALRRQWQAAIGMGAAGVHLLTWNDYSESTQLQPSSFSQFVLYDLNAYFIAWYKAGRAPAILRDALYLVHRPQIVAASGGGRPLTVRGPTPLANDIEVVTLLTAPGEVTVATSAGSMRQRLPAGLGTMRVPAAPGRFRVTLARGGRPVLAARNAVAIAATPTRQDATYGGTSSTRPYVAIR